MIIEQATIALVKMVWDRETEGGHGRISKFVGPRPEGIDDKGESD